MAKKVKFPLKMKNDIQVRTLEELREHFNLAIVLTYYDNGKLAEWLEGRCYESEAENIASLDRNASDFKKQLCAVLGVAYESEADDIDMEAIALKNEKRNKLKEFTADDKVLANADKVAFSQEELEELLAKDVDTIYLCGDSFTITKARAGLSFIGINNPKVDLAAGFSSMGVDFKNVELELNSLIQCAKDASNPNEAAKLWRMAADLGNVEAQVIILYRKILDMAQGAMENYEEADAEEVSHRITEIIEQSYADVQQLAEQGCTECQILLGMCFKLGVGVEESEEEAVNWFRKAAEQGNVEAQGVLGSCYAGGQGVEQNYEEAAEWYRKAAEQGNVEAQKVLGICYREGVGVEQNYEEAVKWYRKAAEQGDEEALMQCKRINKETVKFGDYEWLVLDVQDGKALLLSKSVLCKRPYHHKLVDIAWADCSLRSYLNNDFYNTFSEDIKAQIATTPIVHKIRLNGRARMAVRIKLVREDGKITDDKIFLLSIEEAQKYFRENSERVAYDLDGETSWWWLRSPSDGSHTADGVDRDGYVQFNCGNVNNGLHVGVRPALWVKL